MMNEIEDRIDDPNPILLRSKFKIEDDGVLIASVIALVRTVFLLRYGLWCKSKPFLVVASEPSIVVVITPIDDCRR